MGKDTKIQWTNHTFNGWIGCREVSPACDNCYARELDERFHPTAPHWGDGAPRKMMSDKYWVQLQTWNRAAAKKGIRESVFASSLCDVMEEYVLDGVDVLGPTRERLYDNIVKTPYLDYLLLTKRPQNFRRFLPRPWIQECPQSNIILMTTMESQDYLWRVGELLKIQQPYTRAISAEPLLEPLDLWTVATKEGADRFYSQTPIDWVITGGESGRNARSTPLDWYRRLRDQCLENGVAFFMKQITTNGVVVGWEDWPEDLRIRQFPPKLAYMQQDGKALG